MGSLNPTPKLSITTPLMDTFVCWLHQLFFSLTIFFNFNRHNVASVLVLFVFFRYWSVVCLVLIFLAVD